jgi:hypothetical protein
MHRELWLDFSLQNLQEKVSPVLGRNRGTYDKRFVRGFDSTEDALDLK